MTSTGHPGAGLCALLLAIAALSATVVSAQEPDSGIDIESRFAASLHGLSEGDLKARYLKCSHAAVQGLLGSREIAFCSLGYEVLLQRVFGGDYFALLAWSRGQATYEAAAGMSGDTATAGR